MGWFKRMTEGIRTPTQEKKETPEGLWYKCRQCNHVVSSDEHAQSLWVCENCGFHERINSHKYFQVLFDQNKFQELDRHLASADPLTFEDTKKYTDRLASTIKKSKHTGNSDHFAVRLRSMSKVFPEMLAWAHFFLQQLSSLPTASAGAF